MHGTFGRECKVDRGDAGARVPDPANVMKSFNTWRYKREQPSDSEALLDRIQTAQRLNAPLELVLYWGKGPRCQLAAPDIECLDFLAELGASIASAHSPGACIWLIQTDTHAALNGHPGTSTSSYFHDIAEAARARAFKTVLLSDVIKDAGINRPQQARSPSPEFLATLRASAEKWYGGEAPVADAARHYYEQNMLERECVEAIFPGSIFVTFNNSKHRPLFPEKLPIFYMFSLRKGFAVKPWFLDECGKPAVHVKATEPTRSLSGLAEIIGSREVGEAGRDRVHGV